jgi:transposase
MALFFIPPYSPELNPSEKIWWRIKRAFTGKLYKSIEEVSEFIENKVKKLTNEIVKKTCEFQYIVSAPFWTKIY